MPMNRALLSGILFRPGWSATLRYILTDAPNAPSCSFIALEYDEMTFMVLPPSLRNKDLFYI